MSNNPKLHNSLALLCLAFFACTKRPNLQEYYLPVSELTTGKVYVYKSPTTGDTEYWMYRTEKIAGGWRVHGTYFDRQFQKGQTLIEKIDASGSVAESLTLFYVDSSAQKEVAVQAIMEAGNVFPFQVRDSLGVYLYKTTYKGWDAAHATNYLIRNRRFGGETTVQFQGKAIPAVRFNLLEIVGNEIEGALELEGKGYELYGKGIGLVAYRKAYSKEKIVFDYALDQILSVEAFEILING